MEVSHQHTATAKNNSKPGSHHSSTAPSFYQPFFVIVSFFACNEGTDRESKTQTEALSDIASVNGRTVPEAPEIQARQIVKQHKEREHRKCIAKFDNVAPPLLRIQGCIQSKGGWCV